MLEQTPCLIVEMVMEPAVLPARNRPRASVKLTKLQAVAIERGQLMDRAKEIQGTLETVRANEVRLRNRIQELEQTSEMVRFVLWFIYVYCEFEHIDRMSYIPDSYVSALVRK